MRIRNGLLRITPAALMIALTASLLTVQIFSCTGARVTVIATDFADQAVTLSGAKFDLYEQRTVYPDPAADPKIASDIKTGDDGTTEISGLKPGSLYYLIQTEAPRGYVKNREPRLFTPSDSVIEIPNERMKEQSAQVLLYYVKSGDGTGIAGAVFSVYRLTGDRPSPGDEKIADVLTGDSGEAVIKNLRQGEIYYCIETKAPEGSFLENTPHMFEVRDETVIIETGSVKPALQKDSLLILSFFEACFWRALPPG